VSLLGRLHRLDARVSGWGYEVSGWAGLFVGVVAALVTQEVMAGVHLGDTLDGLAAAGLLLVLAYAGLGLAAAYRRRAGGPSCSVPLDRD